MYKMKEKCKTVILKFILIIFLTNTIKLVPRDRKNQIVIENRALRA